MQYRALLPGAEIIPIRKLLSEAAGDIPDKVDAIVSNHPLDDFIVGKSMTKGDFKKFFDSAYVDKAANLEMQKVFWEKLLNSPDLLERIKREVIDEWGAIISRTHPYFVGISQYEARIFKDAGFPVPGYEAHDILSALRISLGGNTRADNDYLLRRGQDPFRWLVVRGGGAAGPVRSAPEAVDRLGEPVFVMQTAAKLDPVSVEIFGFNRKLFEEYFGNVENFGGAGAAKRFLAKNMAIDLERPLTEGATVTVYVDRQADPLGIALSGNMGSGRAAYLGKDFNLKGIGLRFGLHDMIASNIAHMNLPQAPLLRSPW